MKEIKCPSVSAIPDSEHYWYQDEGPLKPNFINQADKLFEVAMEKIQAKAKQSDHDISIAEAASDFIKKQLSQENKHVKDTVMWMLNIEANDEGVELSDLSAKRYT